MQKWVLFEFVKITLFDFSKIALFDFEKIELIDFAIFANSKNAIMAKLKMRKILKKIQYSIFNLSKIKKHISKLIGFRIDKFYIYIVFLGLKI